MIGFRVKAPLTKPAADLDLLPKAWPALCLWMPLGQFETQSSTLNYILLTSCARAVDAAAEKARNEAASREKAMATTRDNLRKKQVCPRRQHIHNAMLCRAALHCTVLQCPLVGHWGDYLVHLGCQHSNVLLRSGR